METIFIIILIVMSVIICILTTLTIYYKKKLKSAKNLNDYLKEVVCNVEILNESEREFIHQSFK